MGMDLYFPRRDDVYGGGERTKKELLAVSCEGINEPMLSLFFRPLAESFLFFIQSIQKMLF